MDSSSFRQPILKKTLSPTNRITSQHKNAVDEEAARPYRKKTDSLFDCNCIKNMDTKWRTPASYGICIAIGSLTGLCIAPTFGGFLGGAAMGAFCFTVSLCIPNQENFTFVDHDAVPYRSEYSTLG
jgi:hypothetical protein